MGFEPPLKGLLQAAQGAGSLVLEATGVLGAMVRRAVWNASISW